MEDSVGKRLSKARLKRGLSVDEAAHATKLRPDKILALENDDYSTFASNVYARGFLQIYGRFLGVDVAEFASTLEGNAGISIEDYQYLNSDAPPRREERASSVVRVERGGPGLGALVMFLLLCSFVGAGFYLYVNWQRVAGEPVVPHKAPTPAESTAPATAAAPNSLAPSPAAPAPTSSTPAPAATPVASIAAATTPALRSTAPTPPVVADRDFVSPAAAAPLPSAPNEVLVQPIRKTRVVVRKDDPKSPPIFEDYLYPDAPALKLKGGKFFIEASDPSAIQIRKNGAPMAYQTANGEVQ